MLIIAFMLTIWLEEPQPIRTPIDQVGGRSVLSASVSKDSALLTLIRDGLPPVIEIYLFDFKNGEFFQIKDGRIPGGRNYFICNTGGGFVLISKSIFKPKTLTFLSESGRFQDSVQLESYQGFSNKISVLSVGSYRDQQLLVTYQDADYPTKTVFLGVLHLKQKRFERVFQFESNESVPPPWVVSDRTHLYLVNTYNSRIQLLDAETFALGKELLAAQEPIMVEDKKKVPSFLGKTPGFLDFKPILQSPLDSGDTVVVSRIVYREGYHTVSYYGMEIKVQNMDHSFVNLSGGTLTETGTVDLTAPGYGTLRFDRDEGIFVFLKDR